jgi:hypothetical protein
LELNAAAPARTVIALRLELNGAAEATLGVTAERRQSVGEAKAKKSKIVFAFCSPLCHPASVGFQQARPLALLLAKQNLSS